MSDDLDLAIHQALTRVHGKREQLAYWQGDIEARLARYEHDLGRDASWPGSGGVRTPARGVPS